MELKKIGTMRCPKGTVVTQTGEKTFSINSEHRCPGEGPVFRDRARKNLLILHCPEGKKDAVKWAETKGSKEKRKALLKNKPIHERETVEMREEIWISEVTK